MVDQKNLCFDSVILAGGFGSRLAPLTDRIPKPMLTVDGISAFERNIALLKKNGFKKTAVTTMYLPEIIESLGDFSGSVEYFREENPLGSAGAVARLKGKTNDCLLVLSGDAVCDFDLRKAKEEFINSGCCAGMLLCRTKDSGEYGSVCVSNGCITGFCEKPSVRDTLSDLISTGIYFISKQALDRIPDGTKYDFGRDLFPELLRAGLPIAAIEPKGHWFDIGSLGEYHRCNMWASGGNNCIGECTSIHPFARIEHAVIMKGSTIGNSVIRGSIIGENAVIGNDCIIPVGCVIGHNAELRDGCSLSPGSIIESGKTVIGDPIIDCFKKPSIELMLDDDSIIADSGDDGYFVRFGRAFCENQAVTVFAEGSDLTLPKACQIACGVSENASSATVVSGGNAALASFTALEYNQKTAYIDHNGEKYELRLFSNDGMPYSREQLRSLAKSESHIGNKAGNIYLLPHGTLLKRYIAYLRDNTTIPKRLSVSAGSESRLLSEICEELNIKNDDRGTIYTLYDSGERVFATTNEREISYWQLLSICCIEGKRNGIILPNDTPTSVERILKRHSIDVAFYGDSESDMRSLAAGDRLYRDGVLLALTAQAIAEEKGVSISELVDRIPPFSVVTRMIFAERDRMSAIITALRESCGNVRCAGYDYGDGRVNVFASASGRFKLIAEATDSETAEELTVLAERSLRSRPK